MHAEAITLPQAALVAGPGEREAVEEVVRELVAAVADRDEQRLLGVLAPEVKLRFLVPRGPGERTGAAEVAAKYLDWFGDADSVAVNDLAVEAVSDRTAISYRFLTDEGGVAEVVEQRGFVDLDERGRIAAIDIVCSGFRPAERGIPSAPERMHEFDAGAMSCADGLATEFRRRIAAIPVGDVLRVTAADPAAREDLPPLARLMGHTVRSVEGAGDGRLVFTLERGR